ncbi:MAG: hypothetical protein K2Y09_03295 [Nitrosomonas sp.]|uniref:hypothetical protein n=1 Tax=Nitrosomonas sp. TaxID=42353 RepID=UPI001DB9541D|nr:hypothetical protein [Nitrosomonas sp.]MBX9894190.1 hypothetical protein [Nitrosomonas sp.]
MQKRKAILKAGAFAGFMGAVAFVVYAVFSSSSSTAAIGLIFIPFYGFLGAGICWALVYSAFAWYDLRSGNASWRSGHVLFATMFSASFLLAGLGFLLQQNARSIAENPTSTPDALMEVSQRWVPWGRREMDAALARHPSTPQELLGRLVDSGDDAVVQQVGANPNTPLVILEKIAAGPLTYERVAGLAGNRNISRAIMEKLLAAANHDVNTSDPVRLSLYKTYVLAALAANAALPQDLFDRLAAIDAPVHFLVLAIVNAPHANCEQLSRLLSSEPSLENASLYHTVVRKLREKGCPEEDL